MGDKLLGGSVMWHSEGWLVFLDFLTGIWYLSKRSQGRK